jgi:glycosyltransferase involved in cell wall biosynthesis
MKIVQLVPELNEGGIERGTVEVSRELVKSGHTSIVISRGGRLVGQIEEEGGKHITLDLCSKNIVTAISRVTQLRKVLRDLQPDILHARSRVPAWLTYLANKRLKLPFITTVHGIYSVNPYSKIMTSGDMVICISEVLKEYVCRNFGTDDKKIKVIQRGVDLDYFNSGRLDQDFIEEFKSQNNLLDKFIVSSIGRVTYLKDYETFIQSIALTVKKVPNLIGVIVGGTTSDKEGYLNNLKELARSLGVHEKIIFSGSQTRMPEIYALSDLTVNASLTMGNVGRTVLESLAMNTPVLATTYEGLNNIIKDGINGYIIDTRNAEDMSNKIMLLHDNRIENSRESIDVEFTLENMIEKTLDVYQSII